jgi:phosphomevalonate kinase
LIATSTAPGKLILTGEYAVLDGATAVVIAVDRRVVARRVPEAQPSPFLAAVAEQLAARFGAESPAATTARAIAVDSSACYAAEGGMKLGLGSSAAVTVAAAALALAAERAGSWAELERQLAAMRAAPTPRPDLVVLRGGLASTRDDLAEARQRAIGGLRTVAPIDRLAHAAAAVTAAARATADARAAAAALDTPTAPHLPPLDALAGLLDRPQVHEIAAAAHAAAQGAKGARGSGADIAAATFGGTLVFANGIATRRAWPAGVVLIPFFTGQSADTATLVTRVREARAANRFAVERALDAIAEASAAAAAALDSSDLPRAGAGVAAAALLGSLALAAAATDRLASATGVPLVPACVRLARGALEPFGGTAKTTGAGGGDVAIAVIPASEDVSAATWALIEAGCRPLPLALDDRGVDLRPDAA